MDYDKSLPRIDNIMWLTKLAKPFPVKAGDILKIAKERQFSDSTIDFLKLFYSGVEFESSEDFINCCEELEMMIRQERLMPSEGMLSRQD